MIRPQTDKSREGWRSDKKKYPGIKMISLSGPPPRQMLKKPAAGGKQATSGTKKKKKKK